MKNLIKLFLVLFLFSCSGIITTNGTEEDTETLEEFFQFDPDSGDFIEVDEEKVKEYIPELKNTKSCPGGIERVQELNPGLMEIKSSIEETITFYFFDDKENLVCKLGETLYNKVVRFKGDKEDLVVSIERTVEKGRQKIRVKAKKAKYIEEPKEKETEMSLLSLSYADPDYTELKFSFSKLTKERNPQCSDSFFSEGENISPQSVTILNDKEAVLNLVGSIKGQWITCEYQEHVLNGGQLKIGEGTYTVNRFDTQEIELLLQQELPKDPDPKDPESKDPKDPEPEDPKDPEPEDPKDPEPEPELLSTKYYKTSSFSAEDLVLDHSSQDAFNAIQGEGLKLLECPFIDPGATIEFIKMENPDINNLKFSVIVTSLDNGLAEPLCIYTQTSANFEFMNHNILLNAIDDNMIGFLVE
jgi:hypothetical protein